jgi:hypothetical protein
MSAKSDHQIIQPYLFFNGNCEQAVEFYRAALGAQVEFSIRYNESPEPPPRHGSTRFPARRGHCRRASERGYELRPDAAAPFARVTPLVRDRPRPRLVPGPANMQDQSSSSYIPGNNFARPGIFTRQVLYVWM